jgi:Zn-dependent protease
MGRLTLNPIVHIDLIGTLILPLIAHFGWAKPVPVNFSVLNRKQILLVAIAGPVSNLLLAVLFAGAYHVLPLETIPLVEEYILFSIFMNIILAVFNLIPIPPLDGSRIVYASLKSPAAIKIYSGLAPFGIFILVGFIYFIGFRFIMEPLVRIFFNLFRLPLLFGVLNRSGNEIHHQVNTKRGHSDVNKKKFRIPM